MTGAAATAVEIGAAVRRGRLTAGAVTEAALARIALHNGAINAFTVVTAERARATAQAIDRMVAVGGDPGPLAGVPFAVKNLFDIAGVTTFAGSRIHADRPPAAGDATAVRRLVAAGAVPMGALNMDEYAYGFTTENSHYGPTRNPHDLSRTAGGSSGGSGAAVAAGLVPLALGSDTNGSVRVPASFCGVYGLKPSYGRLSRVGMMLFAASLDHAGVLARSVADIGQVYDLLQGADPLDAGVTARPAEPSLPLLERGIGGLRIAIAGGHFAEHGEAAAHAAVARVAAALGARQRVILPEPERARAAAMLITASEGANLHLADLKVRAGDFDPMTRDRFLAGALIPASWYLQAQRFRRWYRDEVARAMADWDLLLAPATPFPAPELGQETMTLAGQEVMIRPNIGIYTQPLSFIGLPVLSVPIEGPGLPFGVQLVGRPWGEAALIQVAAELERHGVVAAPVAPNFRP
ncbi:MAG: AtzE family amidohydrolase [Alphaproteobacteria bacterium]|nr:AtzE family amidohydrolase [Alphaproteobacteria bacterium]